MVGPYHFRRNRGCGRVSVRAPLASLLISSEGAEIQLVSPSIMMLALKVVESSPTTRPIDGKAPVDEALLVYVSSSSSESEDHDIGPESAPHDASKEMQVAPAEIELSSKEIATVEGIFSFHLCLFLSKT